MHKVTNLLSDVNYIITVVKPIVISITIQELIVHSDVSATMVYIHTIKSKSIKESKSPQTSNIT